jgi:hypothetical protein
MSVLLSVPNKNIMFAECGNGKLQKNCVLSFRFRMKMENYIFLQTALIAEGYRYNLQEIMVFILWLFLTRVVFCLFLSINKFSSVTLLTIILTVIIINNKCVPIYHSALTMFHKLITHCEPFIVFISLY